MRTYCTLLQSSVVSFHWMDDESPPCQRCARKLLERAEELRDVLLRGDEQEDDATRRVVIRGFNIVTHDYFKNLGEKGPRPR